MRSDRFEKLLSSCADLGASIGGFEATRSLRALAGLFAVAPTQTVANIAGLLANTGRPPGSAGANSSMEPDGGCAALLPAVKALQGLVAVAGKADAVADINYLVGILEGNRHRSIDDLVAAVRAATPAKASRSKQPLAKPAKPETDPDLIRSYARRLESALGDDPSFHRLLAELAGDKAMTVLAIKSVAHAFSGGRAKSKKDALARIALRHDSLVGARAREASRDGRTAA